MSVHPSETIENAATEKLTAVDVMTPLSRTCSPFSTVTEAVMIFKTEDSDVVPVVDTGKPLGVVIDRDIAQCTAWFVAPGGKTGGRGNHWGWGIIGATMFNTVIPPNGGGQIQWGACRMDCCVNAMHDHYTNATSSHPGGVNVALADGSVRFIKESIAYPTWWALGTRANGEVLSSDNY
jgi:prepilin-type processing-associated H-X9-DG protein